MLGHSKLFFMELLDYHLSSILLTVALWFQTFAGHASAFCFKGSMAIVCRLPDRHIDTCRVPHSRSPIL